MAFSRVAFVAYEPWETRLASRFLEKISASNEGLESLLLVADPYQIRNKRASRRVRRLAGQGPFSTALVFEQLLRWQRDIPSLNREKVDARLANISDATGVDYLDTIMTSDPHVMPRERSPFYGPMNADEQRAACLLVFERAWEILEGFQPDVVVMMWDQYLVKNFVGAVARSQGIATRVFRRVRYQDYLKLDYFFLPLDSDHSESLTARDRQEGLRSEITDFGASLYSNNLAVKESRFVERCRQQPLSALAEVLRRGWHAQRKKLRAGPLSRPKQYRHLRYWASRPLRVHAYLFMKTLRLIRYIADTKTLLQQSDLPEKFILLPLHFRPESAILTQGFGMEDDDVVDQVATVLATLDPTVACLVLEHPSMVEDRRYRFYAKLKKHANVAIADPVISTQQLVSAALGVVTISGTVGLEASIAGIPVHVAGYPEFRPAITSRGDADLEGFLRDCISGAKPLSTNTVVDYLVTHCQPGWQGELGWSAVQSDAVLDSTAQTLVEMFKASDSAPL